MQRDNKRLIKLNVDYVILAKGICHGATQSVYKNILG